MVEEVKLNKKDKLKDPVKKQLTFIHIFGMINGICLYLALMNLYNSYYTLFIINLMIFLFTFPKTILKK